MKRNTIPRAVRTAVYNRDKATCRYCGAVGVRFELEHIRPHSRGGTDELGNLALACAWCNRAKRTGMKQPDPPPELWPDGYGPLPETLPMARRGDEARVMKNLRMSPAGDKAVTDYATRYGINWSEAARRLLAAGLAAERKEGR